MPLHIADADRLMPLLRRGYIRPEQLAGSTSSLLNTRRWLTALSLLTAGGLLTARGLLRATLLSTIAHAAHAATPKLEEIIVKASLQPAVNNRSSVTVFNPEFVTQRGARHLEDLLSAAPNVNAASGASRARFFQIRGIGERSQFVEPVNASVGMLIDDIDFTGIGAVATTWDTAQIDILRGPQGTLFGANALAGLINFSTQGADSNAPSRLSVGIENDDGRRLGLAHGAQLGDRWYGRVALQHYQSDGSISNTWLNRSDTNARDELTGRVSVAWLGEQHRVDVGLYRIDVDNGYDAFSLDNTRQTLSDQPGSDQAVTDAARVRWQFDGDLQWSAQLSRANTDTLYSYDEDWSYVGIAPTLEYSSFDAYERDRDMTSLELRAAQHSERLSWVMGVYLRDENEALERRYTYLNTPFASSLAVDTHALFGQLDLPLSEQLSTYIGARFETRSTDYLDSAGVTEAFSDSLWSGRAGLEWQLNSAHRFYGGLSRGVRAGGVNADLLASLNALDDATATSLGALGIFEEESLLNMEIGWHWRSLTGQFVSDITLFTMLRRDQQAKSSLTIPRADGSTAFIDYTSNAARGHNRGLEWQLRWQASTRLHVRAAVGLLEAEFDNYVTPLGDDLSGRDTPQSPQTMAQLAATLVVSPALDAGVELTTMDGYFFSDRHDTRAPSRQLVNANINWRSENWSMQLWARNLGNETYYTRGFGSFGNDPRKAYAIEPYYQFGEPRRVGLDLNYLL